MRSGSRSTNVIVSVSDATPFRRRTLAQSCSRRWTCSQASSFAAATCAADQPKKHVSAAECARIGEVGRSIASSEAL
jgi:hypothetical protein